MHWGSSVIVDKDLGLVLGFLGEFIIAWGSVGARKTASFSTGPHIEAARLVAVTFGRWVISGLGAHFEASRPLVFMDCSLARG